ncbi:PepSY domain-containing protein [Chitinimonas sp. BJYL2]|uniref:PepSY domain-containing protein n=1 Tax=Chitinimonas sp. BJYL2 TaxID=2976696 RepID=UPI0022B3CEEC|nr:PepSY domain-containing protein [Chitinimonas sp. BJYL2]
MIRHLPLLLGLMLVLTPPVLADVSRDEAASIAQRSAKGRVLSVDRSERDGRPVWRIKLVTPQGEVRVVLVDVASGRVL